MRTKIFLVIFLLLAAGCSKKVEEDREVLAQINDQTITLEDFEDEFSSARREYASAYTADGEAALKLKAAYLNQMIEERLVLMEAKKLGIGVDTEEVDAAISGVRRDYKDGKSFEKMFINEDINFESWRKRVERKLLMDKVISHVVLSQIEISNDDIEEYYNKHIDEFRREEQVRARQILLREEKDAVKARERIIAGEDFAAVARDVSLSPDAEDGGDLGYFSRGVMPPEFDEVVFTIDVGKLSDVVKSEYGYHLFLVEERKGARDLSLEEVREEIFETISRDWEEYLYEKWMEGLKESATIEINRDLLRSIRI